VLLIRSFKKNLTKKFALNQKFIYNYSFAPIKKTICIYCQVNNQFNFTYYVSSASTLTLPPAENFYFRWFDNTGACDPKVNAEFNNLMQKVNSSGGAGGYGGDSITTNLVFPALREMLGNPKAQIALVFRVTIGNHIVCRYADQGLIIATENSHLN
jgi:hypothetical protein